MVFGIGATENSNVVIQHLGEPLAFIVLNNLSLVLILFILVKLSL